MNDNKDTHGFSVSVAIELGAHGAIMIQHIRHLQISFSDTDKTPFDVWVKRSRRALAETYPYLSEKEIRGCLDRLDRDDYIKSKVDNALNYDRTKSYQLSKKGWDLLGHPSSAKRANGKEKASDKRANGFDKRADHNVTKGPMNIGICSSVVTSIVCDENTHAENEFSSFKEDALGNGKVAPAAENSAAAPTHYVTTTDPSDPRVKVVTPFTMPKVVETVDEAEAKIMEWVEGEGRESVKYWYDLAGRKCTLGDVTEMVSKFASVYLTIGNESKRQRMAQDPLQFFKYTFKGFLKKEKSFAANTTATNANGYNSNNTQSVLPKALQNLVGK